MRIIGKVFYDHIPYREKTGFSYCKYCKKFITNMQIGFNEGFLSDWMSVSCGKCHKTIWVCAFKNDPKQSCLYKKQKRGKNEEENIEGMRIFIKDDKKCWGCRKPTNNYDCYASGGMVHDMTRYFCSKKCMDKYDRIKFKKSKMKGGKD